MSKLNNLSGTAFEKYVSNFLSADGDSGISSHKNGKKSAHTEFRDLVKTFNKNATNQQINNAFEALKDEFGADGVIDVKEITSVFSSAKDFSGSVFKNIDQKINKNIRPLTQEILEKYDINKNKKLNYNEFSKMLSKEYKADISEIKSVFRQIYKNAKELTFDQIIAAFDKNKDKISQSKEVEQIFTNSNFDTVSQGQLGDCFFLGGMNTIAQTPAGQNLLEKAIKRNQDGSYDITFPRTPHKTFHITRDMIKKAGDAKSTGDIVMQAFELAADLYSRDQKDGWRDYDKGLGAEGGYHTEVAELFNIPTKLIPQKSYKGDSLKNQLLAHKKANDGKMNVAFEAEAGDGLAISNNAKDFNHILTITDIRVSPNGKTTIIYENPWDMGRKVEIDYEKFKKITKNVAIFNITS